MNDNKLEDPNQANMDAKRIVEENVERLERELNRLGPYNARVIEIKQILETGYYNSIKAGILILSILDEMELAGVMVLSKMSDKSLYQFSIAMRNLPIFNVGIEARKKEVNKFNKKNARFFNPDALDYQDKVTLIQQLYEQNKTYEEIVTELEKEYGIGSIRIVGVGKFIRKNRYLFPKTDEKKAAMNELLGRKKSTIDFTTPENSELTRMIDHILANERLSKVYVTIYEFIVTTTTIRNVETVNGLRAAIVRTIESHPQLFPKYIERIRKMEEIKKEYSANPEMTLSFIKHEGQVDWNDEQNIETLSRLILLYNIGFSCKELVRMCRVNVGKGRLQEHINRALGEEQ